MLMMVSPVRETQKMQRADQIQLVLNRGGSSLKEVTYSEKEPPKTLLNEETSINVAGMRWFPKVDLLSLNVRKLTFVEKCRGKKPS